MKRQSTSEFASIVLHGAGPSLELLGAFALGLLMAAILGNLAYDLLTAPAKNLPIAWRSLAAAAVLVGLAYLLYRRDRRRQPDVQVDVDEDRLALPHAGLVWLFGPGGFDHLLFALKHHQQGGGAAHCWLVMQDVQPVRKRFGELSRSLVEEGLTTQLHPLYIEKPDVQATCEAVQTVFEREAAEEGLAPEEVIADVTGGAKPMTAGMVLAALTHGAPRQLEYVESERDADGWYIENTQRVVLVDMTFYVERKE